MTHRLKSRFICVLASILAAFLITACGKSEKKGQADFEKGNAFYIAQDYKTAVAQFALAANRGHDEAQYMVGRCYAEGKGVAQDMAEAFKWYRQAAENGNAAAQYEAGMMCFYGKDVQIDLVEAVKWLSKAVEQGYPEALDAEVDLSLGWIKQRLDAAEKGDVRAMEEIVLEYKYNSSNIFPEESRGKDILREIKKDAENGSAEALEILLPYLPDEELQHLGQKVYSRWHTEAEKGNAEAMKKLGDSYLGMRDVEKAIEWYKKAVEKGNAEAMYSLGRYLDDLEWLKKAAEKGNVDAMYLLGLHLDDLEWLKKAAEKGNVKAMNMLGGELCLKNDFAEAFKWFRQAAERGDTYAMSQTGSLYSIGRGVKKDPAEALKWYKKAAEKGDGTAMDRIAEDYEFRLKDKNEARKWYRKAVVFGCREAKKELDRLDNEK